MLTCYPQTMIWWENVFGYTLSTFSLSLNLFIPVAYQFRLMTNYSPIACNFCCFYCSLELTSQSQHSLGEQFFELQLHTSKHDKETFLYRKNCVSMGICTGPEQYWKQTQSEQRINLSFLNYFYVIYHLWKLFVFPHNHRNVS